MGKKILILGNGFDLAHGLPTSYADFLNFAKFFQQIKSYSKTIYSFEENISNWNNGNAEVKSRLLDLFNNGVKDRRCNKAVFTDMVLSMNFMKIWKG